MGQDRVTEIGFIVLSKEKTPQDICSNSFQEAVCQAIKIELPGESFQTTTQDRGTWVELSRYGKLRIWN